MRTAIRLCTVALFFACSDAGVPFRGDGGSPIDGGAAPDGGAPDGGGPDGGAPDGGSPQDGGPGGAGTACQRTRECGAGLYCGPTRTCDAAGSAGIGNRCSSTADCTPGLVCTLAGLATYCVPAGSGDIGSSCSSSGAGCLAGLACLDLGRGLQCLSPPPGPDGGAFVLPIPNWGGETCAEDTGPARAYFEVPRPDGGTDFYRLPFPNDIRRTATGLDLSGHPHPQGVLPIDLTNLYLRAAEADLRGFAVNPVIFFRFSQRYNWDSVGGNSPAVGIVDITPTSPTYKQGNDLYWVTTYGSVSRYICQDWIAMRPPHGEPLRPNTTYAALLTTGIVPLDGGTFQRSPDFVAMLASTPPADPALAAAYTAYAPLRGWITASGTDPATILNAAVFTTQAPEDLVPKLRTSVRATTAPAASDLTLCDTGVVSPCDDGTPLRACSPADPSYAEIHGRVSLPIYQQGEPPYETAGGQIAVDNAGNPMVARTEPVCFALTVPRAPPPDGGLPLLLYAHGTGGSFTGAIADGFAAEMAAAPAATLAIDLPEHGARRGTSTRPPDELFFNYLNPQAARDNVPQGAADLMSLTRFAQGFSLAASGSPSGQEIRFDASRIALFAHSQGATHASLMLPYEPGISAAVLSGNGGDLTLSLLNKTQPFDVAAAVPYALVDGAIDAMGRPILAAGDYNPALAIVQGFFERADPVNFARRLRIEPISGDPGRHVFMTYGLGDHFAPPPTLQSFALAAGFVLVRPALEDFGLTQADPPLSGNITVGTAHKTFGLRQYMPDSGEDGHFVATETSGGRADTMRFLLQALGGQTPSIGGP
jgi:hypothetical protein